MVIGAFGDLVFEVSQLKILTFDGFKRTVKAKYTSHEIIGRPAVLEFVGRELEEISLTVKAMANLGVAPEEIALTLREMCQRGEPNYLIIGNVVYGENEMVITDVTETVVYWDGKGGVMANQFDVIFKEYVPRGD